MVLTCGSSTTTTTTYVLWSEYWTKLGYFWSHDCSDHLNVKIKNVHKFYVRLLDYPPVSEVSREVANLTEGKKSTYTLIWCQIIFLSVCPSACLLQTLTPIMSFAFFLLWKKIFLAGKNYPDSPICMGFEICQTNFTSS